MIKISCKKKTFFSVVTMLNERSLKSSNWMRNFIFYVRSYIECCVIKLKAQHIYMSKTKNYFVWCQRSQTWLGKKLNLTNKVESSHHLILIFKNIKKNDKRNFLIMLREMFSVVGWNWREDVLKTFNFVCIFQALVTACFRYERIVIIFTSFILTQIYEQFKITKPIMIHLSRIRISFDLLPLLYFSSPHTTYTSFALLLGFRLNLMHIYDEEERERENYRWIYIIRQWNLFQR
jgi:hypothetical protein